MSTEFAFKIQTFPCRYISVTPNQSNHPKLPTKRTSENNTTYKNNQQDQPRQPTKTTSLRNQPVTQATQPTKTTYCADEETGTERRDRFIGYFALNANKTSKLVNGEI